MAQGWWTWTSCGDMGEGLEKVASGYLSLGNSWGGFRGAEPGGESPKVPRHLLSPTSSPQHLLLEEMDEMRNQPSE